MGRPVIPDEIKAKKGTLKPSRVNKNQPIFKDLSIEDLKPPTYFNKYARSFYINYGIQLINMGVLKQGDLLAFESLSLQVGLYQEAMKDIKDNGIYSVGTNKNGSTYKMASPSITIQNNAYKQIMIGLSKFGLTPSDRSKVNIDLPDNDEEITLDNF